MRRKGIDWEKRKATEFWGHMRRKYGLTQADYESLWDRQGGRCAICSVILGDVRVCVDHDHFTGVVRGLLCWNCNVGIGHLRDEPELLRIAAAYVEGG